MIVERGRERGMRMINQDEKCERRVYVELRTGNI